MVVESGAGFYLISHPWQVWPPNVLLNPLIASVSFFVKGVYKTCLGSLSGLAASVTSTEEAWMIFIQCSMETSVVFFNTGCCVCTQVSFVVAVLEPCSISSLYACVYFTWLERPQRHFQTNWKNTCACHVQRHGLSPNQSASCTSWIGFLCFCLWISIRGYRFPVALFYWLAHFCLLKITGM